jgi:uncharacterized protein (TIGR01777 family)
MKIAVTGASGLIGSALVPSLRRGGHEVVRLVRRESSAPDEVMWDPGAHRLDPAALADVDAVVHLAGAGVGDRRWTSAYRRTVLRSRVDGTTTLARALAEADPRPRVLLSGSAIGWYGDTADRVVDESTPSGEGFLAEVCRRWEAATAPAEEAGVRVTHLRTGVVLAADGGALAQQLPLFRLGLGGRLGSGRQWVSWISLPDQVWAMEFLLTAGVAGPVNLVAPEPVTNAEFTRALGRALHRPTLLRVPGLPLRLALGEFADEAVLAGQRVAPRALAEADFTPLHPSLPEALDAVLHAERAGA